MQESVNDLLCNDDVKKTVARFIENHMPTATDVIIIWVDKENGNDWSYSGNMNLPQYLGLLELTKWDIIHHQEDDHD